MIKVDDAQKLHANKTNNKTQRYNIILNLITFYKETTATENVHTRPSGAKQYFTTRL